MARSAATCASVIGGACAKSLSRPSGDAAMAAAMAWRIVRR
jgi:hypothetical protein